MSLFPEAIRPPVVEAVSEIDRILALPRRPVVNCERKGKLYTPEAQALAEFVTEKYSLSSARACKCRELNYPTCITQLNPVQAWTLRELSKVGGALGFVAVGGGKTICGILAALAIADCKVAALLAKPDQRLHYKQAYLRLREHFKVPSIRFDDNSGYIMPGTPVVHFIPYSRLSRPDSTDLLERLNPDFIICDEAHAVSARSSSRTMRLLRYLANHEDVRFCAWSGTLVKKSIRDQAHLAAHALGMGAPLPLDPDEVEVWAGVFDPSPTPDRTSAVARKLYTAFDKSLPTIQSAFFDRGSNTGVCRGFRERLVQTPGVISTRESSVAASLYIHERLAPKIPDVVKAALTQTRMGERPDGEQLVEQMEIARCVREVASGYHYYWKFRKEDPDELIDEWFAKRKRWAKDLRVKLLCGEEHMDSPLLCANAAQRFWQEPQYVGDLPKWFCESWPDWRDIKDRVPHESCVRWLGHDMPVAKDSATHPGYFLARDAAAWAKENRGIVWYVSDAFGRKIAELAGLPCHGGGPDAEKNILAEDGSRSVIASIKAHGQGRDGLQYKFSKQLIAEIPSSGDIWQQLLGRLCRPGQSEDAVETWIYQHVIELRDAFKKALRDAEFTANITGNAQLLLSADIDFEV